MALVTSLATSGTLQAVAKQAAIKFLNQYGDQITPGNILSLLKKMFPGKKNAPLRAQVKQRVVANDRVYDAPRARNVIINKTAPKFRSTSGKYTITNREYLGTVVANNSGAFVINAYEINAGIAATFPWASTIANTHQKYKLNKLIVSFKPLVGTQSNGRITLSYTIDPHDPVPSNKVEIFQHANTVEGCVWDSLSLNINTSLRPALFVRSGGISDSDINTYDFGTIFVATANAATSTVGDLFIEYEMELHTPKPFSAAAGRLVGKTGVALSQTYCPVDGEFPINGTSVYIVKPPGFGDGYQFRFSSPGTFYVTLCANFSGSSDVKLELDTTNTAALATLLCRATGTQAYNSLYLVQCNSANTYLTASFSGAGAPGGATAVNATITVAAAADNQTTAANFISSV